MKRIVVLVSSLVLLCSLLLIVIANAGNASYSILEWGASAPAVADGKWTTTDEWNDAPNTPLTGNTSGGFGYDIQDFTNLGLEWIVEIFNDNTNNPGDYFRICFDDGNNGGAAPSAGDYMIEISGHTTLKVYQGSGTGWTQITPAAGEITWANTLNTSRWSSTPHWILEVIDSSKTAGNVQIPNQPPTGMLIAAFDAATNSYCSWAPGGTADKPDTWGVVSGFSQDPIPESFSLGATLLIASVAMLAGYAYLRKRQKPAILTPKNLT